MLPWALPLAGIRRPSGPRDFGPLIRLPNTINATFRASCSAIQRMTGDRVISLRKPLPAPIRSWVYGDFEMNAAVTAIPFLIWVA
jgi:hypothetical protein